MYVYIYILYVYTNISIDDCKLRKRQRRSIYRLQIFSSVVSKNRKVYLTVYFYLFMYTYTQTHTYIHREVRIETGRTIISESINIASRLSLISIRWLTAVRSSALLVVIKDKKKKRKKERKTMMCYSCVFEVSLIGLPRVRNYLIRIRYILEKWHLPRVRTSNT